MCIGFGSSNKKKVLFGCLPLRESWSFGEREARDIRGVLRNCKGDVLFMFFKQGVKDSNEAEALAILEAFRIYLIVKNNSSNAILWVNSHEERQWTFKLYFNEIKTLLVSMKATFCYMNRSTNGMTNVLANQGFVRASAFRHLFCILCFYSAIFLCLHFLVLFGLLVISNVWSPLFMNIWLCYCFKKKEITPEWCSNCNPVLNILLKNLQKNKTRWNTNYSNRNIELINICLCRGIEQPVHPPRVAWIYQNSWWKNHALFSLFSFEMVKEINTYITVQTHEAFHQQTAHRVSYNVYFLPSRSFIHWLQFCRKAIQCFLEPARNTNSEHLRCSPSQEKENIKTNALPKKKSKQGIMHHQLLVFLALIRHMRQILNMQLSFANAQR